jgi:quercetin dioxygenase-like cupin family protein
MTKKKWAVLAGAAALSAFAILLHASTATVLGVGNLTYSAAVNGPADVTFRQFTSMPGEIGPWHMHPGSVYNIVTAGAITIEDGCGGEQTYTAGQGWEQINGRVHRWKNLGTTAEAEYNTFIVPEGSPTTDILPAQECGPPTSVNECRQGGWMNISFPTTFADQADCLNYVRKHD